MISPSGAVSEIVPAIDKSSVYPVFRDRYDYQSAFRFGSSRHLGEPAAGEWTLRITDHNPDHAGTLKSWSLRIYGHGARPAAPTGGSASQSGTSLTISWTAPTDTGASAITGYDLRHIRSDASDGNWTVRSAVATADASPFTLTGLETDVQYDLQVRAVNSAEGGPWSDAFISIKPNVLPAAPTSTSVSAGHVRLHATWRRPNTGSASWRHTTYAPSAPMLPTGGLPLGCRGPCLEQRGRRPEVHHREPHQRCLVRRAGAGHQRDRRRPLVRPDDRYAQHTEPASGVP